MVRVLALGAALALAFPAHAQAPRDGKSIETAVVVKSDAGSFGAVESEGEWLRENYPGWRRTRQALIGRGGRRYDRIEIVRGDEKVTIYFDITDAFGAR